MSTGRIFTIKHDKGFGFITDEAGGENRFFHANSCITPFSQLKEGLVVSFDPYEEPVRMVRNEATGTSRRVGGPRARDIKVQKS